jgi:hypothetical protein
MYLYVKTHNETGLKYLGKTTKQDPHRYPGSGTLWIRHLKKHGYNYTTEILLETTSKEELIEKGIYYSDLWNIVESKEWANLKKESGDGGDMSSCPAWQEAMSKKEKLTGEKNGYYGKTHTLEIRKKISENAKGKQKGIPKPKTSESLRKRWETEEHFNKGKEPWNKGKTGVQNTYGIEHALARSKPCRYNGIVYHGIHACANANNTTKYKIEKLVDWITVEEYRSLQQK